MTEISIVASMFPPERTATAGPDPLARPAISAATPTAPAPSTTNFERSSRSTIASLISSSETVTISSRTSSRIAEVSSPGCLTAIPSAIVYLSRRISTPTTRTTGGALRFGQGGDPRDGSSNLERARPLEVLGLEDDLTPCKPREGVGRVDRRDARDVREAAAGALDLSECRAFGFRRQGGTPCQ